MLGIWRSFGDFWLKSLRVVDNLRGPRPRALGDVGRVQGALRDGGL